MSVAPGILPGISSRVSNRQFIKHMERWGWEQLNTKAENTEMRSPQGIKVQVRAAEYSGKNSTETIRKVLAVTGKTETEFFGPDANAETVPTWSDVQAAAEGMGSDKELEKAYARAARQSAAYEKQQQKQKDKPPLSMEDRLAAATEGRRAAKRRRDAELAASARKPEGDTTTRDDIMEAVRGLDEGEPFTTHWLKVQTGRPVSSVGNATSRMVNEGILERVQQGTFRVVPGQLKLASAPRVKTEPIPAPMPEPETSPAGYTLGATPKILELIQAQPQGMEVTTAWVRQQTGFKPATVHNSLSAMTVKGVLRRVSTGVYVLNQQPQPAPAASVTTPLQEAVAGLVPAILAVPSRGDQRVIAGRPPRVREPQELETPVTAVPSAAEAAEIAGTTLDSALAGKDADDVIDQLLDRLFPSGFKARHLKVIDRWRTATHALIEEIEG
jgi:hypothetical protein